MSPSGSFPPSGAGHRLPAARGTGARRGFGGTWWGRAWVAALEDRARLDPNRLPRGRRYARSGAVGDLVATGGQVRAQVQGSRARPYAVVLRVRAFTPDEWERCLDAMASQAGHAAALLDGELLPEVLDDVAAAGLDLLPGAGELGPRCSCPDAADPCKHAAAVCYLVADLLDADPFVLLLLRGREREAVLAGLRARRTGGGAGQSVPAAAPDAGVPARAAWARVPGPLPQVPRPPSRPGAPALLAVDPPPGSPLRRDDLVALAADAAGRAWELATGEGNGGLQLSETADLARRAALVLGTPRFEVLAARAEVPPRSGGAAGLAVLEQKWDPDVADLAEGRDALAATGKVRVQGNTVTCGPVQLRLGLDGLWWRLDKVGGVWELHRPPSAEPQELVDQEPAVRSTAELSGQDGRAR
jgi:uncharacterized Zn finger protein